jgi:fatty-acyl-CoA synthase
MIISGGENVYPSEVEAVARRAPGVADVAVHRTCPTTNGASASPPRWCAARRQSLDPAALIDWSKDKLAGYKRPRSIIFLTPDEMPRNATGKILHRVLRTCSAERRFNTPEGQFNHDREERR